MAAYVIAEIEVTDPETYEGYKQQVPAVIADHGGTYLARGGAVELLEGEGSPRRTVILRFETMEAARAWYTSEAYQPIKALRQSASRGRMLLVEGV
jgi:uncharacterized protein (DUF1330 family)